MEELNLNLNNMKPQQQKACVFVKLYDAPSEIDMNSDFILPDYLPDVARTLRVTASPRLGGVYVSGGKLEYEGEVAYDILFLAEDGRIHDASFTGEFENSIDIPGISENSVVINKPAVTSNACRLLNPRKYNMKTKVNVYTTVLDEKCVEPQISGKRSLEDEMSLEKDLETQKTAVLSKYSNNTVNVSEDVELEGTYPQISELISCGAEIYMYECKCSGGKINCKGDAIVNIVYEGDSGEPVSVTRKIPVTYTVEPDMNAEAPDDRCECVAKASPGEMKTAVQLNSYGEKRVVELDFDYGLEVFCARNNSVDTLRDVYSTECECSAGFEDLDLMRLNRVYTTNFSVNASNTRAELNAGDATGVLNTAAAVRIGNIKLDGERGKVIIDGSADITCITEQAGPQDTKSYGSVSFTVPIKCELDGNGVDPDFACFKDAYVISSKGRLDSNNVYADLEIALNMMVMGNVRGSVITEVTLNSDKPVMSENASPITLYYPQKGESLWDIAKHYKVTRSSIREANALTDKPNVDAKVLIIPRKRVKSVYSAVI